MPTFHFRDVRLPKHVLPSTYDLRLIPFIKADNYTIGGSININANVVKDGENSCQGKVQPQDEIPNQL